MTVNHPGKELIQNVNFSSKTSIISGAEHNGLRKLTGDKLDKAIYTDAKN